MLIAAIPLGGAIGVAIGMLGGGGSVLAVPVLVYVVGENVHEATTASLVIVTAGALAGGVRHARGGRVCWRQALAFSAAALPGVAGGTALGNLVSGPALIASFGLITLAAAAATWRKAGGGVADAPSRVRPACPALRLTRTLVLGVLVGAMTGFFGVGGGFLLVPTLAVLLALSVHLAVGTSLAIITATSLMGLAAHLLSGRSVDIDVTGAMAVACAAGALLGAAVAGRVPERLLGRGFATLVAGVASYLLVSAVFLGGPPGS